MSKASSKSKGQAKLITITLNAENSAAIRSFDHNLSPKVAKQFSEWAVNTAVCSYVGNADFPAMEFGEFSKEVL